MESDRCPWIAVGGALAGRRCVLLLAGACILSAGAPCGCGGGSKLTSDAGDGCHPVGCSFLGAGCGTVDDGCGGTLDCGTCPAGMSCGGGGTPNDCGPFPRLCSHDGWCWENPLPQGHDLFGIWGSGADDVWAVGEGGTILHWDGTAWSLSDSGTTATLRAVGGSGPDDAWAVGDAGILHWDGTAWTTALDATPGPAFLDVWAAGPDAAWAGGGVDQIIGSWGRFLQWDGSTWSDATVLWPGPDPSRSFIVRAIWGTGPDDVWAIGEAVIHYDGPPNHEGYLLHFSGGTAWSVAERLYDGSESMDVGSEGPDGVWLAIGDRVARPGLDGGPWLNVNVLPTCRRLWFAAPDDGWVVGQGSAHWDGAAWTAIPVAERAWYLEDVWGSAPNDVWAVGRFGTIVRWDGAAWENWWAGPTDEYRAVWAAGDADVWVVGRGARIDHRAGAGWLRSRYPHPWWPDLLGVWGHAANELYVVGEYGTVLRGDGTSWVSAAELPDSALLTGVWSTAQDDLWVVGQDDHALELVLQWDGAAWTSRIEDTGGGGGIWGTGPDDVWLVGARTHHRIAGRWNLVPNPAEEGLADLWGSRPDDVWFVGPSGTLLHWDGVEFGREDVGGVTEDLWGVWSGSPGDAWSVGDHGTILHREGGAWLVSDSGTVHSLRGIRGTALGQLWAVGDDGTVLSRGP